MLLRSQYVLKPRGGSTLWLNGKAGVILRGAFFEAPAPPVTGRVKVWTGAAFEAKPVKVWSGSAWVEKTAKVWTGSAWA